MMAPPCLVCLRAATGRMTCGHTFCSECALRATGARMPLGARLAYFTEFMERVRTTCPICFMSAALRRHGAPDAESAAPPRPLRLYRLEPFKRRGVGDAPAGLRDLLDYFPAFVMFDEAIPIAFFADSGDRAAINEILMIGLIDALTQGVRVN